MFAFNNTSSEITVRAAVDENGGDAIISKKSLYSVLKADTAMDMWALGVVLYQLCTGQALFQVLKMGVYLLSVPPLLKNFSLLTLLSLRFTPVALPNRLSPSLVFIAGDRNEKTHKSHCLLHEKGLNLHIFLEFISTFVKFPCHLTKC